MIGLTVAVGVGWAWPTDSPLWLICVVPACFFLLLTVAIATEDDEPARPGSYIGPFVVMVLAWIGGQVLLTQETPVDGPVTDLWLPLNQLWPLGLLALGLTRWVFGKIGLAAHRRAVRRATRDRELAVILHEQRTARTVSQPSLPGRSTGYEPAHLALLQVPDHRWSYGEPTGRTESFARALVGAGLHNRFATFWSYGKEGDLVDCVVVTGRRIIPIDVEDRVQGDVTWLMADDKIRMVDHASGGYVGGPQPASVDVSEASRRIRELLTSVGIARTVDPMVVFLPTEQGIGTFEDVHWPGGVPALGIEEALRRLADDPDFDSSSEAGRIIDLLRESTGRPLATYDTATASVGQPMVLASCPACGVPYEHGMTYCLSCGQVRS